MRPALAIACLLLAVPARAEDPPIAVTLADVVAATPRAPAARIAAHEVAAADALVDAGGAWPNPALHVETNRLTARLAAGVSVPLPVFGTIGAAKRLASAHADATRADAVVNDRELRHRAIAAWIALARADGAIVATETAAKHAAEIERIARGRLDAGVGGDVDVTTAQASRARAELDASTAKRERQAASAELAGVLGWDPSKTLTAVGDVASDPTLTLDVLRARLATHPVRVQGQRRIAEAEATIAQVRSERWPSVALEGQVSMFDPGTPGTDVLVGLSLELPIFARNGDRARSARATAAAERAKLLAGETQLGAELVAAFHRWQAASERLAKLQQDILPAQERAAMLSAQAYREGARDLASAIQADRDLATVRAEILAAHSDVASTWTDLQLAAGDDLGGTRAR